LLIVFFFSLQGAGLLKPLFYFGLIHG